MPTSSSPRRFRNRYRRITFFFARILLSLTFWELILPRLGLRGQAKRTRDRRLKKAAVQFRALAIEMGGVLIKVGQFLSSRVDVLPAQITSELSGLQDEVPPAAFDEIRQVAEAELGGPLSEKFDTFDTQPMAAASLGQVYHARVHLQPATADTPPYELETPDVVVKIQRPHIEEIIRVDLEALKTVGNWVQHYPPVRKRTDVPALLAEFTRILFEEIDYLAEGQNADTFATNFDDDPRVRVPRVVWSHTTRRLLTLEDVQSIKITDYAAIQAAGIAPQEVAQRLLETYLRQIFEDGFFHADPHPGNMFVHPLPVPVTSEGEPEAPQAPDWQLTFIDFGMVGHVPPKMRAGMRELIIGVGLRDPARVVKSYTLLGVLLPGADVSRLELAEGEVFDRFWGRDMNELTHVSASEVRDMAFRFRDLLYSLPFQIPEDLILLGRCVGILSGMCTGLDPNFNVWESIAPFAQKLVVEEAINGRESWLETAGVLVRKLAELPVRMDALMSRVERGELAVRDPQATDRMNRLERAIGRGAWAVIFAALLLGGVQLIANGQVAWGQWLLGGSAVVLVILILSGRK